MKTRREKILVAMAVLAMSFALGYRMLPDSLDGDKGRSGGSSFAEVASFPPAPKAAGEAALLATFDDNLPMASPSFAYKDDAGVRYMYTGYLSTGDTAMAVLDGNEYQVGDTLPDGLTVVGIEKSHVLAEGRDMDTGRPVRVRTPFFDFNTKRVK